MLPISAAFKETMFRYDLKGSTIARDAGVKPGQISALKRGGNLTLNTFEKILNALPHDARNHLLKLVECDDQECCDQGAQE